jgi:hypothetical protein
MDNFFCQQAGSYSSLKYSFKEELLFFKFVAILDTITVTVQKLSSLKQAEILAIGQ